MVMKKCKICGKEFDAQGSTVCCSPECRKLNKRNINKKYQQSEKGKEAQKKYHKKYQRPDEYKEYRKEYMKEYRQTDKYKESRKRYEQSDKGKKAHKKYQQSNKGKETQKKYRQSEKGKKTRKEYQQSDNFKESQKKYYESDKGKKAHKKYVQKKITELNKQYSGDLEKILENIPGQWMEREAKMQVWFGESYYDGMITKIESTPICEVTGEKDDLVIHHLNSFNTHPELGNDVTNMVRITKPVHDEFHNIYGRSNNTPEQWIEFLQKINEVKKCY